MSNQKQISQQSNIIVVIPQSYLSSCGDKITITAQKEKKSDWLLLLRKLFFLSLRISKYLSPENIIKTLQKIFSGT